MKKLFFTLLLALLSSSAGFAREPNHVPVPFNESGLKTVWAQPWFTVSPENHVLEGAIFDRDGNLLFCNVSQRKVMRVTPDRELSTVVEIPELAPGGLALHEDGRIFIAAIGPGMDKGAILALSPSAGKLETILPVDAGYLPNDLALDKNGGFYFSDFRGSATNPAGGVYYVAPGGAITPVIPRMSQANGVALAPDGQTLWAGEFARNQLHRATLQDAIKVSPTGSCVPYHFTGPAPDSMRVDGKGNLYVAIYEQGRVLVFNQKGIPIGQILLPGREQGRNLLSTSLAIQLDGQVYVVTSDETGVEGAQIFHSEPVIQ